jgi:hypothetical protein
MKGEKRQMYKSGQDHPNNYPLRMERHSAQQFLQEADLPRRGRKHSQYTLFLRKIQYLSNTITWYNRVFFNSESLKYEENILLGAHRGGVVKIKLIR